MSVEEKIRRAEEIYERKKQGESRTTTKVPVNNTKKDIKLFKKMFIQILICLLIYFVIYIVNNNKYVFSDDFINKVNEILSYDTNFIEIYNNIKNEIKKITTKIDEEQPENPIEGADVNNENVENIIEQKLVEESQNQEKQIQNESSQNEQNKEQQNENNQQDNIDQNNDDNNESNIQNLSQEEQDIIAIKNTTSFIKPVEGIISSRFGIRETATGNVPKNHTGTDIAANLGTKIKSATDGEVVLASSLGDYR